MPHQLIGTPGLVFHQREQRAESCGKNARAPNETVGGLRDDRGQARPEFAVLVKSLDTRAAQTSGYQLFRAVELILDRRRRAREARQQREAPAAAVECERVRHHRRE